MASQLSNYLANMVLNWLDGDAFASAPSDVYVALFDGDPTATGAGGTEVTTTIRAGGRLAVTWDTVSGRAMASSADIDFGDADAGADITHGAVFDASSSGNMLLYGPVGTPRTITTGDPVVIPAGDISANFN